MSPLLVYDYIWLELLFLLVNLGYIIAHFGINIRNGLRRAKEIISNQTDLRKKSVKSKSRIKKTEKEEHIPQPAGKKLTATELQEIDNVIKKIQAKNSIGKFEEAKSLIIQGLIIGKHHLELNLMLASYYERYEQYDKAELIYKDLLIADDGDSSELYILLGNNLMAQGKDKLAFEVYRKWLKKDPENIELLRTLADLAYRIREYEESNIYAMKWSKKQPKNISALEILAESFLQMEQHQKAYEVFLKLRSLDPYNAKVQKWVEELEIKLGLHPANRSRE